MNKKVAAGLISGGSIAALVALWPFLVWATFKFLDWADMI